MQRFSTQSTSQFDRYIKSCATLCLGTFLLSLFVFFAGVCEEVDGQAALLMSEGREALQHYLAAQSAQNLTFSEYMSAGLNGSLQSFGGNQQALGLMLLFGHGIVGAVLLVAYAINEHRGNRMVTTFARAY